MKRFSFRLQQYLNLKQQQEDLQSLTVVNVQAAYEAEKGKLEAIDRAIAELLAYCAILRQKRLDVGLMLAAESYHAYLAGRKEAQTVVVAGALDRLTAERERLQVLQRDRKLLQRLREKRWTGYYQDFLKEEQKNLDEIGIVRSGGHGRQQT